MVLGEGRAVPIAEAVELGALAGEPAPRLLGEVALPRQEEYRVLHRQQALGARILQLHAALETAGAYTHEGDAVAVLWVDIGLHLEDKTGDGVLVRSDRMRPLGAHCRL